MDWQQIASLGIVALTAVLLVRSQIRNRRKGTFDCCKECARAAGKGGALWEVETKDGK